MDDLRNYWPKALGHLREPYDNGVSDHVVIAESNEQPQNGYKGARLVRTALIPLELVDEVLRATGGIGHEVRSWGPRPCVDEAQVYETSFWIDGRKDKSERFQTIINSWNHHDREVILPDNILLMTYGLTPRYLNDGIVCWDDPRGPVYDVLRVKSHVNYGNEKGNPSGFVKIRRAYLEDYCHLKKCAAVAVYYEERFSLDDESFAAALHGRDGAEFELPGRTLDMAILNDKYHADAPLMSRVWGSRLILVPRSRPVTDPTEPKLTWPGDTAPMNRRRAAAERWQGYVRDEVLQEYEDHPEYQIRPESGGVAYGGWWGTARTFRVGRNHICIELKKLYEGCPPQVVSYWHRFSVTESVAQADQATHGNRNIAVRAKDVLDGYLALTANLASLSDQVGITHAQEDIGYLSTDEVAHHGWWSFEVMRPLFAVAPMEATREQFLDRAVSLFKLMELLKTAPLRAMSIRLGVPRDEIKEFASLKLLACICQLAWIAKEQGHALTQDADAVVRQWNCKTELPCLRTLFALCGLRIAKTHTPGSDRESKVALAAAVFGIDVTATASGWGYAIDALYDRLADDLFSVARLIQDALEA